MHEDVLASLLTTIREDEDRTWTEAEIVEGAILVNHEPSGQQVAIKVEGI